MCFQGIKVIQGSLQLHKKGPLHVMNGQSKNVMKYEVAVVERLHIKCLAESMRWVIICLKTRNQHNFLTTNTTTTTNKNRSY